MLSLPKTLVSVNTPEHSGLKTTSIEAKKKVGKAAAAWFQDFAVWLGKAELNLGNQYFLPYQEQPTHWVWIHASNPSAGEAEALRGLGLHRGLKTARALQGDPVSKQRQAQLPTWSMRGSLGRC